MIKINLVTEAPAAAAVKKKRPETAKAVRKGDVILLTVLVLALAVTGGKWYLLSNEREDRRETQGRLKVERDKLQKFIKKAEELEAKRAALQHKINVINELKNAQTGPVRIMDEVSKALPELVWLESLNLNGTALTLGGKAMDENAVANYISNLNASPYFKEPVLKDMARGRGDTFQFRLDCVFVHTPPKIDAGT
jgi:type IV pilus assembly protein PilN